MNVAVLGASNKPDRYSYKAIQLLQECGHRVFPIHPKIQEIEGMQVFATLKDLPEKIHTLTLYVSADISSKMLDEVIACDCDRIIFNPGTENMELKQKAEAAGIKTLEACTLVMLRTKQFE